MVAASWPNAVSRTLVISNETPTDTGYFLHSSDPFSILGALPTGGGDGIVLEASARAFGANSEVLVQSEHELLLDDGDTLAHLDPHL
jgi:hypothetical protein